MCITTNYPSSSHYSQYCNGLHRGLESYLQFSIASSLAIGVAQCGVLGSAVLSVGVAIRQRHEVVLRLLYSASAHTQVFEWQAFVDGALFCDLAILGYGVVVEDMEACFCKQCPILFKANASLLLLKQWR
ncbi:hypothetical protein JCGZ_22157 [Jatropha curcas]|uniref:Uncharacterized protein n=1 Tax=Jatropha curcas TaxID=180498 RepID=A0A067LIV6_JATCU|nr:hypothetical protein JCGZ_22157 [Jatropha curcas]